MSGAAATHATPAPSAVRTGRRWGPGTLSFLLMVVPAAVLVGVLFIAPIGRLVGLSVHGASLDAEAYRELFASPLYVQVLLRTLRISALVVLGCFLLGYPIAYALATSRPRTRQIIALLVLLPFWTSLLVRNYAWVYLLQWRGVVNELLLSWGIVGQPVPLMFNEVGVVIGMTNALLPFMVLPIYVAIQAQDPAFLEAAESLGAMPSRSFFAVTFPLSLAGVYAGSLLVFATALGFFVTPALLGGGKVLMAATFIAQEVEQMLNWPLASAASIVLLIVVLAVVAVYTRVMSVERLAGMGDVGA